MFISDWQLEASKLLTPSSSRGRGRGNPPCKASVCAAAAQRSGRYSVKVSVSIGRLSGLVQGRNHEIRPRDYHSSVRETTAC